MMFPGLGLVADDTDPQFYSLQNVPVLCRRLTTPGLPEADFLRIFGRSLQTSLSRTGYPTDGRPDLLFQRFLVVTSEVLRYLDPVGVLRQSAGVCGKQWKVGETAFTCKTCEMDPSSGICGECFGNGNHEGHDYAMINCFPGVCDCGDSLAWKESGWCFNHRGPDEDPLKALRDDSTSLLLGACRSLAREAILRGVVDPILRIVELEEALVEMDDADEKKPLLGRELTLIVSVTTNVIQFLTKALATPLPCFKRLFCEVLHADSGPDMSVLESVSSELGTRFQLDDPARSSVFSKFFDAYIRLHPPPLRKAIVEFLHAIISDPPFKRLFAPHYIRTYGEYFIRNREQPHAAMFLVNISVQIFACGAVVDSLLLPPCSLIQQYFGSINSVVSYCSAVRNGRRVYTRGCYDSMRTLLGDGHDIFNYVPAATKLMSESDNLDLLLQALSHFHSYYVVWRVDEDDENQAIQVINLDFVGISRLSKTLVKHSIPHLQFDVIVGVIRRVVDAILKLDEELEFVPPDTADPVIEGSVVNGPLSFNLPLHRLLGLVLKEMFDRFPDFDIAAHVPLTDDQVDVILKCPLRSLVGLYHVFRRWWPRDNLGVARLAPAMFGARWIDYCLYSDLFLLQVFGNRRDLVAEVFQLFAVHQDGLFRSLARTGEIEDKEVYVETDVLRFLLTLYFDESFSVADKRKLTRTLCLHELYCQDFEFAVLMKRIPRALREGVDLPSVFREVANEHRKDPFSRDVTFQVKEELWEEFNPYQIGFLPPKAKQLAESRIPKGYFPTLAQPNDEFDAISRFRSSLLDSPKSHALVVVALRRILTQVRADAIVSDGLLTSALHMIEILARSSRSEEESASAVVETPPPRVDCLRDVDFVSRDFLVNLTSKFEFLLPVGSDPDADESTEPTESATETSSILRMLLQLKERKVQSQLIGKVVKLIMTLARDRGMRSVAKSILAFRRSLKSQAPEVTGDSKKKIASDRREKVLMRMQALREKFELSLGGDDEEEGETVQSPLPDTDVDVCCLCHRATSPDGKDTHLLLLNQMVTSAALLILENRYLDSVGWSSSYRFCQKPLKAMTPHVNELYRRIHHTRQLALNGCCHQIHLECYTAFFDSKKVAHAQSHLNLGEEELLCPICSRIQNNVMPDLSAIAIAELCDDENPIDDSLHALATVFSEKHLQHFQPPASVMSLTNDVAHNICNREAALRSEPLRPLDRVTTRLLSSFLKTTVLLLHQAKGSDEFDRIVEVFSRSLEGESVPVVELDPGPAVIECDPHLPLLSVEIFPFFVRHLLLQPELMIDPEARHSTLRRFYFIKLVQIYLTIYLLVDFPEGEVPPMASVWEKVAEGSEGHAVISDFVKTSLGDDFVSIIDGALISFVRRCAIFFSLLEDGPDLGSLTMSGEDDQSGVVPSRDLPQLLALLGLPSPHDESWVAEDWILQTSLDAWLEQFFEAPQPTAVVTDVDMPFFLPPLSSFAQFECARLPELYQDLVLKYPVKTCDCGKPIGMAYCLLSGSPLELGACSCLREQPSYHPRLEILLARNFGNLRLHCSRFGAGSAGLYIHLGDSNLIVMRRFGNRMSRLPSLYRSQVGFFQPSEVPWDRSMKGPMKLDRELLSTLIPMFLLSSFDQVPGILDKTNVRRF